MPLLALVIGGLLTALGAVAYSSPELLGGDKPYQISALSPAFIGVPLGLAGLLSLLQPTLRKHAMHAAAMFGLLGTLGGLVPAGMSGFDFGKTSVQVGLAMAGLSLLFLVLCVKSFIDVRKARKLSQAATV